MTYSQTIEYLYSAAPMFQQIGSAAYKEGMENSFLIDERLGHPHRKFDTVHVGGTNGKGSVSHLLASVLQESGYKTGLYTSPHLLDFRERIRVNGQKIEKRFVINFIRKHKKFFETIKPSFFELTTGMAFAYFAEQKVDIAIIEVGLGGRLDCTNIITPLLSIITNISLDHTNLLGNTPTAIAKEKAGIIKQGVPVVIGEAEEDVKKVFEDTFFLQNTFKLNSLKCPCKIVFASENNPIKSASLIPDGKWKFDTNKYPNLIDELGGYAQEKNAATVLTALEILSPLLKNGLKNEAVYSGFDKVIENTGLMGRWQIVGCNPKIIFDTGHNVGGMEYNVRQLRAENSEDRLRIVFGMVNDKDISAVLDILPKQAKYYFTQASLPRALDSKELAKSASTFGLNGQTFSTVKAALSAAKAESAPNDTIFVGGSTFVVAEGLKEITDNTVKKQKKLQN